MEKAQLPQPVRGNLARHERTLIVALVAILTLGLASPAQAGLGDLIDGLLDPIEQLPVVGGIVDPIVGVTDPLIEPVEPVLAPVVDPLVEVVEPVLAPVVDPLVEVVKPVLTPIADPVVEHVTTAVDLVNPVVGEPPSMEEVAFHPFESVAASIPSLARRADEIRSNVNDHGSLVLAQTLQAALAGTTGTLPTVAGALVDKSGAGWFIGLTDWLRSAATGLVDLLSIPLRLLEILLRALLTAGSGLVAPASLALAFTIYAVRDRRWHGIRKTALN